jgi:hypothetical protein
LSAVSLSSMGNSIGNREAPERPRTQRITSADRLPSTGIRFCEELAVANRQGLTTLRIPSASYLQSLAALRSEVAAP